MVPPLCENLLTFSNLLPSSAFPFARYRTGVACANGVRAVRVAASGAESEYVMNHPIAAALAAAIVSAWPAQAHDQWSDGEPVPAWVKSACCGPEDAHHLRPDEVHLSREGWQVNGYHSRIPHGQELPSPDGTYWIFYRNFNDGTQSNVYCFFVPIPSI
jgi:hypothetical protein